MLTLFQPVWLLLLVPLAAACLAWPLPNRGLKILRVVVFLLVVLALAQLAIKLPDRAGTVIVVADRSESMPQNSDASEREIIGLLYKSMKPRDQLGVVSFGREAIVEQSPQRSEFGGFTGEVGPDHSDLNAAIDSALALIPPDGGGRILVLSDGKWTGKDPAAAAARAAGRGVAVDYRLLTRPQINDTAIQSFLTPQSVLPGEAFVLSTWVQSPVNQEIQYQLRRGDDLIASGSKEVSAGLSRLMFRDRADEAGVNEYTMTIQGATNDPVPENNTARALVGVEGAKPVLVVSSAGDDSGFVKLLRGGDVDVVGKTPAQCQWSLEELSQYSAVILENVDAGQIGMSGMDTIASWVENTGSGLAITGGQKSYGPGGYYKSPLERILPVSMEMRREHRQLSVAVVVALDRSGSMAMPAGGGREKIDLADLGTVQVLDLLSPEDEIGVFAVDTVAHEIVPLDTVEHNEAYRGKILAIGSEGGGIYIYEALVASAKMISAAHAQTKHIILFSDAADAEQSAHYQDIVAKLRDAGVTVSVVGLGTEHDKDADMLKDLARRGGGECYFSDNPDEIPRIFAQDTFTIARSTFVDQPTPFSITAGYSLLGSQLNSVPPSLGGYNLCYLRPTANLAAVTDDEYKAPVVASWNAGNGRVLCYLGEADGKYSGDFAKWNQAGEFYSTLARWVAGKHQPLPDDMLLTQEIRDGVCFVQLHLDPERKADPFSNLPQVKVLHGLPGAAPAKDTVSLQWKNADLLEAAIPIAGRETVLNTVEIPGQQPVTLPPVCLPYSPEFAPDQPGRGANALAQIATTTGGEERVEIPKIWEELPVKSRYVVLAPWLLVAATILFLLEVLERRTGWVTRFFGRRVAVAQGPAETDEAETPQAAPVRKPVFPWLVHKPKRAVAAPAAKSKSAAPVASAPAEPKPAPQKPATSESSIDAMRKARERAKSRTDKRP
ncbi:MAG TPA: VWA domain-containing protein [Candidatus Aquilonibacter sp.]|nr:VWA domain-containing protein [Candidatus Aquilonibacter sp.]